MYHLSIAAWAALSLPWTALALTPAICNDPFNQANTTVNVTGPGLSPNTDSNALYPYSTYTTSTAVKQFINHTSNTILTAQRFWLTSTPSITTSPQNIPFLGCALLLRASPGSSLISSNSKTVGQDPGCKTHLSSSCRDAIFHLLVAYIIDNVISPTTPQDPISGQSTCSMIASVLTAVPPECGAAKWDSITALEPFGNPSFATTCSPSVNVFNGSASDNFFHQEISSPVSMNNHTAYDTILRTTVPIIFAGWPKARGDRSSELSFSCLTPLAGVAESNSSGGMSNAAVRTRKWVGRGLGISAVITLVVWYAVL